MAKVEISIAIDDTLLHRLDALVAEGQLDGRGEAIERMIAEHLVRLRFTRLAEACSALDQAEERALAEEGLALDVAAWPPL